MSMSYELEKLYKLLFSVRDNHDVLVLAMLGAKKELNNAQQDIVNRCISSLRIASDNLSELRWQISTLNP